MADIKKLVDTKIAGKKVMVFSKTSCPYCVRAKKALDGHVGKELKQEDYEVLQMENRDDCGQIQDYLLKITGGRSVPRVFINGKFIGGGDETTAYERSGELAKMLA